MPVSTTANEVLEFSSAGRIPAPGDNVAIAIRTLPAGTRILIRQLVFEFSHTVLEGHRFAIFRLRKGEALLSWGLPFGLALRDIEPGEYVCNEKILRVLKDRNVNFELPATANFSDFRQPFALDETSLKPGLQVRAERQERTFLGYRRNEQRGVGTRNFIVVMGTSSRTAPLAREVSRRFDCVRAQFPNVDGVVAIGHTEGGGIGKPNNFEMTLRTLAGFVVNANVGAILCVDQGNEVVSNAALKEFLREHRYPLDGLPHQFISMGTSYERTIEEAAGAISESIPVVNECRREEMPLKHLRLGLQCGGSDAFSGVSANPLLGLLSRDAVAQGGSANLAETSELIGAESFVLANVRDLETARAFLRTSERFQHWAAVHGHSAEGNPSGGNMYRGLYNIVIKSIGAARKKDPTTRLDFVIDFGERMKEPGMYFMDSPGNDLESIAGQVAAGCNLILFATGNGSITNFPFVPTIKVMTTTARFELVRNEMDFNAGRYQDGESLEDLGREAFDQMIRVASGEQSAGEMAGHSQVQLWREWRNNSVPGSVAEMEATTASEVLVEAAKAVCKVAARPDTALVLPTSLCSGQIALAIAEKLNQAGVMRAVALPHTEGCGNSIGASEQLFLRTMTGYLAHPLVERALLLEHGCEKTHNDAFKNVLREAGLPETGYAFHSVQMDGGIERVTQRSIDWFRSKVHRERARTFFTVGLHGREMPERVRQAFGMVSSAFAQAGAAVVQTMGKGTTIEYGEQISEVAAYRMECPTDDDLEIVTGLGATGVEMMVVYASELMVAGNPLVPTIRVGLGEVDVSVRESDSAEEIAHALLRLLGEVQRGEQTTVTERTRNLGFQITRGREGISL